MKKSRVAITFLLIAVAGVFFGGNDRFVQFKSKLQSVVLPVSKISVQASRRSVRFFSLWSDISSLQAQADRLSQENLVLKATIDRSKELERENAQLRELLSVSQSNFSEKTIVARVVGLAPEGFFQTVTIDRGAKDNIHAGAPVVQSGFLVGRVLELGEKTAIVRLVTAHSSVVPVVTSSSRAKGLLRGGVKGLVIEDIPVDAQIEKNESIVTAGLVENIPAGISVGQVEEIVSNKGDIFQTIKVKTPVDFNQLEIVAVLQ